MNYENILICKICNKIFIKLKELSCHIKTHNLTSEEYSIQYLNRKNNGCYQCGNKIKYRNLKLGYAKYCSSKCANSNKVKKEKMKETTLKNYGVDNPMKSKDIKNKQKETLLKNYNIDNPMKSKEIKDKYKQTSLKNYGVTNPMKSKDIQNKIKKNCLNNYGVDHPMKLECNKQKIKETCIRKYNNSSYINTKEFKEKSSITLLKNYDIDNPMKLKEFKDKQKETLIKNYDIDNPMKLKEFKDKQKETLLKNYNVTNPMKSKEIKDKQKETLLKNYGVDNPMKSKDIKDKIKNTIQNKYGYDYISQIPEFKKKIKNTLSSNFLSKLKIILKDSNMELIDKDYIHEFYFHKWKCLKCKTIFETCWNNIQQFYLCPTCHPRHSGKSKLEKEIVDYILYVYKDKIIENSKSIISPLELDIYIPKLKVAIEFNGLYWHSEKMLLDKSTTYHLNKTNLCEEQGIQLIHIFEDEWILKKEIVKSRISNLLKLSNKRIYARKCIIKEIDSKIKNSFLETNHIQSKDNSSIKLGAFYKDELVSVMTFSKGNISKGSKPKDNVWELNRFCSKLNYSVVGIAGKLFKYFKRNYEWIEIFSYADRRWSTGNVYYKLGFNFLYDTTPNYWYIKDYKRIHRFNLRKRKDEPKDIPERILRIQEGYDKIYDCGNKKFSIHKLSI